MWTKILLLLLIGATTLLAAPPENGQSSDLCPINFEILTIILKSNKEEIRRQVDLGFKVAQEDAKKLDLEVSGYLEKQEKSVITIIEALKTSLLAEMTSGFGKVGAQLGKIKNIDVLEEKVEKLEKDLAEKTEKLEKAEEKGKKRDDTAVSLQQQFEKLSQNLTECGAKLKQANKKVNGKEQSGKSLQQQSKKLKQNLTESATKLEQAAAKTTIKPTSSNCQKAKLLSLTRVDSGLYFYHPKMDTNWTNAKNFCVDHGMQLLTTLKTWDKIKTLSDANPHKENVYFLWIGASDVGPQPGQYFWADGTKVDEALWKSGDPNSLDAGEKTCLSLYIGDGKLFDYPCSYAGFSFICEVAGKDLPC